MLLIFAVDIIFEYEEVRSVGGVTVCSLIVLSGFGVCDVLFIAACYRFSRCSLRPQPLADRALWLVKAFQPSCPLGVETIKT